MTEVYVVLFTWIGIVANQLMLVEAVMEVTRTDQISPEEKSSRNIKIMTLFFGKFVLLGLVLTVGSFFIGDRIILALLNYVVQIFVVTLSTKKAITNS